MQSASVILLVEDNDVLRTVLADMLELLGYAVYAACCGEEAVAAKIEERIGLVISDLAMPGMNALELYEALSADGRCVKMLILTGYPMPHTGMSLVERAEVKWARKPIRIEELERVVEEMLAG